MQLGIDIGGTTINLGLVDHATVIRKDVIPSFGPGATKAETIDYLSEAVRKMIVPEVTGIGIGVPTVVDPVNGIAYNAVNIPSWGEVHLKDELEARFHIPVFVNNDANCFALGASARMDRIYPVLVGITLGTGLGMGVVCDGKLSAAVAAASVSWDRPLMTGLIMRLFVPSSFSPPAASMERRRRRRPMPGAPRPSPLNRSSAGISDTSLR